MSQASFPKLKVSDLLAAPAPAIPRTLSVTQFRSNLQESKASLDPTENSSSGRATPCTTTVKAASKPTSLAGLFSNPHPNTARKGDAPRLARKVYEEKVHAHLTAEVGIRLDRPIGEDRRLKREASIETVDKYGSLGGDQSGVATPATKSRCPSGFVTPAPKSRAESKENAGVGGMVE